jgi:two-component system response regulator FixJ
MATGVRPSVAVVEDDEPVRRALARVLAAAGFRVTHYASAEEYLATASADDCVLIDVHLPEMDGFELCDRLRRGAASTSVVLITADHDLARSPRVRRRGAVCLTKPVDEEALVGAIRRAMKE